MINRLQNRNDSIAHYALIALILITISGALQINLILYGIILAVAILSFHNYIEKAIKEIIEKDSDRIKQQCNKFGISSGQIEKISKQIDIEKTATAAVDILIAVPMFGLGKESSKYILIFVLGISVILLYNIQYKIYKNMLQDIKEMTPRRTIFILAFVASVAYISIFEPHLVSISFYQENVIPQVTTGTEPSLVAPILTSANHIVPTMMSILVILSGVLVISLYISLLSALIGMAATPILLLLTYLSNLSSASIFMKGWILISIIVVGIIVFYYRRISDIQTNLPI
jgi:hypothetical protein